MRSLFRRILWFLIITSVFSPLFSACQAEPSKTQDQGFLVPTQITTTVQTSTLAATFLPSPTLPLASPTQVASLGDRVGFGLSTTADPALWASRLGASWYLDWAVKDLPTAQKPERWQMIRLSMKSGNWKSVPLPEKIASLASKNPGHVWIIGNEPDVIWQDSLTPEIYAQAYHDLYTLLKQSDPSAEVAPAGISQATELRLAYLDRVLAEFQRRYGSVMPVDWWTVHGFVLREEKGSWGVDIPPGFDQKTGALYEVSDHNRLDLFTQQLIAFRKWMAGHGYRDAPLALTEFGILMPPDFGFPPEDTAHYLQQTFHWLLTASDDQLGYPADSNHLIQRWAWFSLSDKLYPASDLADLAHNQLTMIGSAFEEFTRSNP